MGCGMPEGETGMNIARNAALAGGCPVTTSGTTINRFCSSGLQAVAMAAQSIIVDGMPCAIGGGLDSISLVQPKMVKGVVVERSLMKSHPALWMPMIDTADLVASRYGVARERLDEYALRSQQRTAAAQAAGYFDEEIVPMDTVMMVKNKEVRRAAASAPLVISTCRPTISNHPLSRTLLHSRSDGRGKQSAHHSQQGRVQQGRHLARGPRQTASHPNGGRPHRHRLGECHGTPTPLVQSPPIELLPLLGSHRD